MAELDYAFLADHAQIENGRLFVTGGSFTHVSAMELPSSFNASLAGRIRANLGDPPSALDVVITAPDSEFSIELSGHLGDFPGARPYGDGRVGRLFALNFEIPLVAEGLYTLVIKLESKEVRRLAFDVEHSPR